MLVSMTLYILYFGVQAHLQEYRCILSEKMNTCLMETNFILTIFKERSKMEGVNESRKENQTKENKKGSI